MHVGRRYTPIEFFKWTLHDTIWLLIIASIPTILYELGLNFLSVPWQPLAILGTALAFIVGFKNNASYGRIWEARQIYGAIINDSRSFAYTLRDLVAHKDPKAVQSMFYRHFAWLTIMRYQLREPRNWENMKQLKNQLYRNGRYDVHEWDTKLEEELDKYLAKEEVDMLLRRMNRASQVMAGQSKALSELKNRGLITDLEWTELQKCLFKQTENQGKAERIKNFPYPRNFSSVTTYLLYVFILLIPFGLLKEYSKLGDGTLLEGYSIWLNIPFSALVAWAFNILDSIGESAVNPFEGSANDVPITQISRAIEIDMREMLNETDLPPVIVAKNNIVL